VRAQNKCDRCEEEAKIFLGYGPHRFCREHFLHYFEKRVQKTMRTAGMIERGEKIAIGVSGGKDSMVTLHLLSEIYAKTNPIEAILIDEGIHGYRDKSMQIGIDYCKANGIPYHTVSFQSEFGVNMEQVMQKISGDEKLGSTCSFCGVFRRHFLNKKAMEIGAAKLATGHNLDDEVQSIAMNLFNNDLVKLARLGEKTSGLEGKGFVPRIKPLYDTPEKEIIAYAAFKGLRHYSEECCPYSWTAKRNLYRKVLNELEEQSPGTKHSILATFRQLKPVLLEKGFAKGNTPLEMHEGMEAGVSRQLERLANTSTKTPESKSLKKEKTLSCAQTKGTTPFAEN
ncbi:MAG: adenine nucleotide alpha hydrolase family protein, partial [archaeon]|nr:adenine nucleotide alpha hydrolase family protein [archaeon]